MSIKSDHPITPPPELVQQWAHLFVDHTDTEVFSAAARWGADQELEACCEWVSQWRCMVGGSRPEVGLRAARRPKPPSLREQALADLDEIGSHYIGPGTADRIKTIRRALESLPND